jgi:hypothetical protein
LITAAFKRIGALDVAAIGALRDGGDDVFFQVLDEEDVRHLQAPFSTDYWMLSWSVHFPLAKQWPSSIMDAREGLDGNRLAPTLPPS